MGFSIARFYSFAILPSAAMSMVENQNLAVLAEEVEPKLKKVIEAL